MCGWVIVGSVFLCCVWSVCVRAWFWCLCVVFVWCVSVCGWACVKFRVCVCRVCVGVLGVCGVCEVGLCVWVCGVGLCVVCV